MPAVDTGLREDCSATNHILFPKVALEELLLAQMRVSTNHDLSEDLNCKFKLWLITLRHLIQLYLFPPDSWEVVQIDGRQRNFVGVLRRVISA